MIYGIGTDLVAIARMQALLQRWGSRLAQRLLAEAELAAFDRSSDPARFLAKRFAVKEAFAKAVGTGVRAPVLLSAIWIEHDVLGKPVLTVSALLEDFLWQRGIAARHVSISDERDHALAFVILEQQANTKL
ncbi:holo-ACP synthase [Neisseriaceae bacterium TC5R-5]|nr:holo-ACP synthase [Neisseriaceae bacterium TC5R-5]